MHWLAGIGVTMALLAGCLGQGGHAVLASSGPVVEGWVVDDRIMPVTNATVSLAGSPVQVATDQAGHYRLETPTGTSVTLVVAAQGYQSKAGALGAFFGMHQVLNFSLVRLPADAPYVLADSRQGQLTCAITAVAGQDDPNKPHEHKGVRCTQVIPESVDASDVWNYTIPAGATGVILEAFWTPESDLSQALVMKIQDAATGDIIGFTEGVSPLHVQVSHFTTLQLLDHTGVLRLSILPGAGTGSHEHGAVGVFIDQPFTLFATAFFNQPVDPAFSVANGT
jgi:hypothetical protein